MPKYVIERDMPGVGKLSNDDLRRISQESCAVLSEMGPEIRWIHSYVTADKIYCVYMAPNEEVIRQHGENGGFPTNRISRVQTMINPATATGAAG
ncbi:MAG: DUF4242 domain-containing protein [Opitutales bacterium]